MKYILTITNPDLSFEVTSEITSERYELLIHQVMKGDKGDDATPHPYISLERLRPYLYRITFDSLPEDNVNDGIVSGGCSAYVQNGKLYRNLDFRYDNAASFIVRCKDFEGMSFVTGLDDGNVTDELASQLPYCVVDGCNNNGIMVSTHILFNDWEWQGSGTREVPLTRLPFMVLSKVKSMSTIATDLEGVLGNLTTTEALDRSEYLIQVLVTDGTTTCVLMPPTSDGKSYVIQDITSNPKLTNFRWVEDEDVERIDLQMRPTGVERWNMMPCPLSELQFTKAYQSPTRISEFIGLRETTKYSTDEQLLSIYEDARLAYLTRTRDGVTWQTMHSVVYGDNKMESLYIQENWDDNCIVSGGGGGEGTNDHRQLTNRDATNQHPINSITGLQNALDGKQPSGDYALTEELDALADALLAKYEKPSSGIPKNDLSEGVQSSLDKADTALQEHQSLAAYRTASEQDTIDAGKQPLINDLVTIRSGAALGATALQSVPNTYRTAAAQDIIDNAFDSRLDALEADYAIALTLI